MAAKDQLFEAAVKGEHNHEEIFDFICRDLRTAVGGGMHGARGDLPGGKLFRFHRGGKLPCRSVLRILCGGKLLHCGAVIPEKFGDVVRSASESVSAIHTLTAGITSAVVPSSIRLICKRSDALDTAAPIVLPPETYNTPIIGISEFIKTASLLKNSPAPTILGN